VRVTQPPSFSIHLSPSEPKTLSPPRSGTRCSADSSHARAHRHTPSISQAPLASPRSACPFRPPQLARGPQTCNTQNRTAERVAQSACPFFHPACLTRRVHPPGGFSEKSTLAGLAKTFSIVAGLPGASSFQCTLPEAAPPTERPPSVTK